MRTVALASVRQHARRYVAAGLAIAIGVAFVVLVNGLASSARAGIQADLDAEYAGTEHVLVDPGSDEVAAAVDTAAGHGASVAIVASAYLPVTADGVRLDDSAEIGVIPTDPALQWQDLVAGSFPDGPDEIVVEQGPAERGGVGVGDRVRVGEGEGARSFTVVGVVRSVGMFATSAAYVDWADLRAWESEVFVRELRLRAADADALDALTSAAPTARLVDRTTRVDEVLVMFNNGVDVIAILGSLFAAVAFFVAGLVIANTFAIMLAQRTRELALLRCVGATGRQVRRALRLEALGLGVLAAAVGVAVGAGLAHLAVPALRTLAEDLALGPVALSSTWVVGAALLGIATTLLATALPLRRASRTTPMAALAPADLAEDEPRVRRARLVAGAVLAGGGLASLIGATATGSLPLMLVGGAVGALAVLVLLPVLVPGLVRLTSRLLGRVGGPPLRLAAANAVRNPRRSGTSTAALLVGTTLISAIVVGMASARSTMETELDRDKPLDAVVLAADPDVDVAAHADRAAALDGVAGVAVVDGAPVEVDGAQTLALGVDGAAAAVLAPGAEPAMRPARGTATATSGVFPDGVPVGQRVRVRGPGGALDVRVEVGRGAGNTLLLHPDDLRAVAPSAGARALWIDAADGADADALTDELTVLARASGAELTSTIEDRAWVTLQLDVVLGATLGLLGVSVLIALFGIANTLGLSVLERAREHALLRALGLTRRQLRATLAGEALLLAGVAGAVGVLVGTFYGWVGVRTLTRDVAESMTVVVPVGQLVLVVLVAGVAGLAASVLPGRRAAATAPAAGLVVD